MPAPENWVNCIGSVPMVTTFVVVCTHPVLSYRVPPVTNIKSPPSTSCGSLKSEARSAAPDA